MKEIKLDNVKKYYNASPEREWKRLEETKLEFLVTMHFISRFLPPNSVVLDVGGGPGRYAIELSQQGHTVDLLDLSVANIRFAQQMAKNQGVKLRTTRTAEASDLSFLPDSVYDMVLNLGPMYHLLDEERRQAAIRESIRVTKPGGKAVFAFLSKYSAIYYQLRYDPAKILEMKTHIMRFINEGYNVYSDDTPVFTDAFYVEPNELEAYMQQFPIRKKLIVGAEGMVAQSEFRIYSYPKEVVDDWLDLVMKTAHTNAALNASEHILFFGEKV